MKFSRTVLFLSMMILVSANIIPAEKIVSPDKGIKADIIQELNEAEEKITSLANDFSEDKYSWRPEEEVRSVSEVLMHVAGGNFFILSVGGVKMPEGMKMDMDMEKKMTDKKEILDFIKKSYAFSREKITEMKDKDLEKMIDFFGSKITTRHLLVKLVSHSHEHLGQLIAYARMNGITPSWSKKEN